MNVLTPEEAPQILDDQRRLRDDSTGRHGLAPHRPQNTRGGPTDSHQLELLLTTLEPLWACTTLPLPCLFISFISLFLPFLSVSNFQVQFVVILFVCFHCAHCFPYALFVF